VETDISSWPSILKLFKFTFEKYGRIDIVAANAGIHGHERWLEDITTADGELAQPDFPAVTVNLIGMLYSTPFQSVVNFSLEISPSLLCEESFSGGSIDDNGFRVILLRYCSSFNLRGFETWCSGIRQKHKNDESSMGCSRQHDCPLDD